MLEKSLFLCYNKYSQDKLLFSVQKGIFMKKHFKYISFTALVSACALLLGGCFNAPAKLLNALGGTGGLHGGMNEVEKPTETGSADISAGRGTDLSFTESGTLKIQRLSREEEIPMGSGGGWTVFVYLCGSDLESGDGSATLDLLEMQNATDDCDKLRFVVEADGTRSWDNEICKSGVKKRLLIANGFTEEVYSGRSTNMGEAQTLADFLLWGITNYADEHMVLDLWDHGGGSITGVCFDELNDSDSLSLEEIDSALRSVYGVMTDRFDIIGCDACLMATAEFANVLVPYAEYMVCSQEMESGYGWDYGAFADGIEDGASDGVQMGRYICDGYYESCRRHREASESTISLTDLSRLDDFLTEFDLYAGDIYKYSCDSGLNNVLKASKSALNFGGNNKTEGYTNMVDLAALISNTANYSSHASSAYRMLSECVIYSKNGVDASEAGGLSVYFPLSIQGSYELSIFKNVCVSPSYLSLVDLCAYASDSNGDIDGYDFNNWFGAGSGFWSDIWNGLGFGYWDDEGNGDDLNFDGNSTAIKYDVEPYLDEEGYYRFKLSEESLDILDTVYCNIMMSYWDEEDGAEYMLDLGTDDYVDLNWYTGECQDNFSGYWFSLPDGQPLCVYLSETYYDEDTEEYYNLYTAPVYINDKSTNLRIKQSYFSDEMTTEILGAWDGINENGSSSRDLYQLQSGDRICPVYPAYDVDTGEYITDYYGDEYICSGDMSIEEELLYEGDYYYAFEIYDIYDNALYTDFVMFGVEDDGTLYYYE